MTMLMLLRRLPAPVCAKGGKGAASKKSRKGKSSTTQPEVPAAAGGGVSTYLPSPLRISLQKAQSRGTSVAVAPPSPKGPALSYAQPRMAPPTKEEMQKAAWEHEQLMYVWDDTFTKFCTDPEKSEEIRRVAEECYSLQGRGVVVGAATVKIRGAAAKTKQQVHGGFQSMPRGEIKEWGVYYVPRIFLEEPEGTVSETNISWHIDWENHTITGGNEELIKEFAADHMFPEAGTPGLPPGEGWTLFPDPEFERGLPAPAPRAELPAPRPAEWEGAEGGGEGAALEVVADGGEGGGVQFATDPSVEILGDDVDVGLAAIRGLRLPPDDVMMLLMKQDRARMCELTWAPGDSLPGRGGVLPDVVYGNETRKFGDMMEEPYDPERGEVVFCCISQSVAAGDEPMVGADVIEGRPSDNGLIYETRGLAEFVQGLDDKGYGEAV